MKLVGPYCLVYLSRILYYQVLLTYQIIIARGNMTFVLAGFLCQQYLGFTIRAADSPSNIFYYNINSVSFQVLTCFETSVNVIITLLFWCVWIRWRTALLFAWEMQQINAIWLNIDAYPMNLTPQASSIRSIKISARIHWICLISLAKVNKK